MVGTAFSRIQRAMEEADTKPHSTVREEAMEARVTQHQLLKVAYTEQDTLLMERKYLESIR